MSAKSYAISLTMLLAVYANVHAQEHDPEKLHLPEAVQQYSINRLIDLAKESHPQIVIAQAQLEAARGRLIQAGLYPNPTFEWRAENLGDRRNSTGGQGPFISQRFLTAGKLQLAVAAAEAGVEMADWQSVTLLFQLITQVRRAYYDFIMAEREVQTLEAFVRISGEGLKAAQQLQKAGAGSKPDELRAMVEFENSRAQLAIARQQADTAWRLLTLTVGLPHLARGTPDQRDLHCLPEYEWDTLLAATLSQSSEVYTAQAGILQAEQLVRRTSADRVPDLDVRVRPFYDYPTEQALLHVYVGTALPFFNRNQGNIAAAYADLTRAKADAQRVELDLSQRLATAFQQYQASRRLVQAYQERIVPHAASSLNLIRKGYQAGDAKYDFTAVQQAQTTLFQVKLQEVQALRQFWLAVSDIQGLLQVD